MVSAKSVIVSGQEVLPIVEGGKGIGATNGHSAGAFAAAGAVGTFSAVNAEHYDENGQPIPYEYKGVTRRERHEELIAMSTQGGIDQAKIAHETSGGNGRIHMNVLWEMGGAERILENVLENTKGLVHGITCGAGMPYRLAEIAEKFNVYYYPIVSSMRAFRALWKRSYHKLPSMLGGVVYEDPWKAGGHNGLSNSEDPNQPEDPFPRVAALRKFMNEVGLNKVPIVMAGNVWFLREWKDWLDNPEIGPITFQYGTRPLLTKESPIPEAWKKVLTTLKKGEVFLNRFSPTGFYSSAVNNEFIQGLRDRSERQVPYKTKPEGDFTASIPFGPRKRPTYLLPEDKEKVDKWMEAGFDEPMKTPDDTLIFETKENAEEIVVDQINCMGCLSVCKFSNWMDFDSFNTGKKPDPRSFCIQKTLQDVISGINVQNQLMFAGHAAYRFADDPFYSNGFVPTVKQLVERMMTGD